MCCGSLAAPDVAPDLLNGVSLGRSVSQNLLQESCAGHGEEKEALTSLTTFHCTVYMYTEHLSQLTLNVASVPGLPCYIQYAVNCMGGGRLDQGYNECTCMYYTYICLGKSSVCSMHYYER